MPWCRKRYQFLLLFFLTSWVGVAGCGRSIPGHSQPASSESSSDPKFSTNTSPHATGPATQLTNQQNPAADTSSWQEAAREDPDPRVRLHAIETWSQKPGDTLDPVTHALVDPDETVRVRAQQLFEDALARK